MTLLLEYIASIGVIISFILISLKKRAGFTVGLIAQSLWIIFGIIMSQWGFVIMCIFLTATCIFGLWNWNKKPELKKKKEYHIYIAHPISIGTPDVNMRNLIDACEQVWRMGHYAYGALLNLTWEVVYPKSEKQYLEHDIGWLKKCDIVWRLPGESKGADQEVRKAKELGIPICYSLKELKNALH